MQEILNSIKYFVGYTVVLGIIYPISITGIAQLIFPHAANGSLIKNGEKIVGSALIGQEFLNNRYFWGRPSATSPSPYNAESSSGSNQALSNPDFQKALAERLSRFENGADIPIDLVTASGSGLDPDISIASANIQIERIAKSRSLDPHTVFSLITQHSKKPFLRLLGEPRVNVLELNLALDSL